MAYDNQTVTVGEKNLPSTKAILDKMLKVG